MNFILLDFTNDYLSTARDIHNIKIQFRSKPQAFAHKQNLIRDNFIESILVIKYNLYQLYCINIEKSVGGSPCAYII